jgi:hypothetical protein
MAVRKVGTSRIVREIGRGGMAVVYEAFQEALDRRVAIKVLDAGQARSKEATERFRREGRAYAHLHHASVLAVYDLIEKDDALYLVTEFVDGADLRQVIQAGGGAPARRRGGGWGPGGRRPGVHPCPRPVSPRREGGAAPSSGAVSRQAPATEEVVAAGIPGRRVRRFLLLLLLSAAGPAGWYFGR